MRRFSLKYVFFSVALSAFLLLSACGKVDLTMSDMNNSSEVQTTTTTTTTTTAPQTTVPPVEEFIPDDSFVKCQAAICYDLTKGEIIYEKNADERVYPA